jgi:hypothetical protein
VISFGGIGTPQTSFGKVLLLGSFQLILASRDAQLEKAQVIVVSALGHWVARKTQEE